MSAKTIRRFMSERRVAGGLVGIGAMAFRGFMEGIDARAHAVDGSRNRSNDR